MDRLVCFRGGPGVMTVQYLWTAYTQVDTIPYSQFNELVSEGKVVEVTVDPDTITGTLKAPLPDGRRLFTGMRVDPDLVDKLAAKGVVVSGAPPPSPFWTILAWSCRSSASISSGSSCSVE
jgi:cell division protease FtsH